MQPAVAGGAIPWGETLYLTLMVLVGIVFICGGIQGFLAGVGDMRRTGALEWPLRVLLILGGLLFATPGGGILPFSSAQIVLFALMLLVPTVLVALLMVRRSRTA